MKTLNTILMALLMVGSLAGANERHSTAQPSKGRAHAPVSQAVVQDSILKGKLSYEDDKFKLKVGSHTYVLDLGDNSRVQFSTVMSFARRNAEVKVEGKISGNKILLKNISEVLLSSFCEDFCVTAEFQPTVCEAFTLKDHSVIADGPPKANGASNKCQAHKNLCLAAKAKNIDPDQLLYTCDEMRPLDEYCDERCTSREFIPTVCEVKKDAQGKEIQPPLKVNGANPCKAQKALCLDVKNKGIAIDPYSYDCDH